MAKKKNKNPGIIVLVILHVVGLAGFTIGGWEATFRQLVPWHLLICLGVLLYYHKQWTGKFFVWALLIIAAGFGIEWLGVKTGVIFGHYSYGSTLGYKWQYIPVIIGVNWFILLYCSHDIAERITKLPVVKALLTGIFMVLMDFLIEPVAMAHGYWSWRNGVIPVQNYIAWWVVGSLMAYPIHSMRIKTQNNIALPLYAIQLLFFMALNMFL